MLRDFGNMLWKEWREFRAEYLSNRLRLSMYLAISAYFALALPLIFEEQWLTNQALIFWMLLPTSLALPLAADTFAGERERHSLETLLALPLNPRAIVLSKCCFVVLIAWAWTQIVVGLSILSSNVLDQQTGIHSYEFTTWIPGVTLSLGLTIFVTALGLFISMHTTNVKQAQMLLGLLIIGLMVAAALLLNLLPHNANLVQNVQQLAWYQQLLTIVGIFLLFAQGCILLSIARIKRTWQLL